MFRIGQFATLARVSPRQLRHWDQLGLLTPEQVDDTTGYRAYRAGQLPRLNRIVALKDLGFHLDEIRRLVDDEVGPDELRGMLELKRSQTQAAIEDERMRLRAVEGRIEALAAPRPLDDVRVVALPGGLYVSHRFWCDGPQHGLEVFGELAHRAVEAYGPDLGQPLAFAHGDGVSDDGIDLEMGWLRDAPLDDGGALLDGALRQRHIPDEAEAIVTIRRGDARLAHEAYGSLLRWLDDQERHATGVLRELIVELPTDPAKLEDAVVELQLPIAPAGTPDPHPQTASSNDDALHQELAQ